MRRSLCPFLVVLTAVFASGCVLNLGGTIGRCCPDKASPAAPKPEYQRAVDAVYPALVRLEVVRPEFRGGREVRGQTSGSGVIISPQGHIVTNHHVAGRATQVIAVLPDKEEVRARRVGTDPMTDICVLKLEGDRTYPYARWGDSSKVAVGDTVLAMGSPGALSQSVTAGIASNVDLVLPDFYRRVWVDDEDVGALVKWIAHDAAIFPGNSGGPLVNLEGEVVGINEIGLGLGAAIPSNLARQVVEEILRRGQPERSQIGIVVQPMLEGLGRRSGVFVGGVLPDSPAEQGGLLPGDIILSYAGQPVNVRFAEDLPDLNRLIAATPVGDRVRVVVERDGERKTLTLQTRLREPARTEQRELTHWGMAARDITETRARWMRRESTDGAVVTSLRSGGPAATAKPAISYGDIITAVNGEPIASTQDLIRYTNRIVEGQDEQVPVLVAFERGRQQWLTLVKVGIEDLPTRVPEVRRAWLQASTQVLTADLAEALELEGVTGVRLTEIFEGGNADRAGLQVGDIVTAVEGEAVRAVRPEDDDVFPAMIRRLRVGAEAAFSVIRDGEQKEIAVELVRSPMAPREMERYRRMDFGFSARDISEEDARRRRLEEDIAGPIITDIESGSLVEVGGLRTGDIVLRIDGRPVPTIAELKNIMTDIEAEEPDRLVFFVRRGIITAFIEVETPWMQDDEGT